MLGSLRKQWNGLSPVRGAAARRSRKPVRKHYRPRLDPLEERWTPAVFTVTTLADNAPGPAVSLREAIQMANQTAGPDTIDFASNLAGHTINLTQGALHVTDDLIINGPANRISIDAGGRSRILVVDRNGGPAISVQIDNLRLIEGHAASGGAIINAENLTLKNVVLSSNVATGGFLEGGGAIFNHGGNLTLQNCSLRQNRGHEGGAIRNQDGRMTIIGTALSNNSAQDGGALSTHGGNVTLDRANLTNNKAKSGGGAMIIYGTTLKGTDANISHNVGSGGGAVLVYNSNLEFVGTTLANDRVDAFGSAIFSDDTALTLTNSTVANNAGAAFFSGAISAAGGSLTLRNATVVGTQGSNGLFADGTTLTLSNSIVALSHGFNARDVSNQGTLVLQGNNLVGDGSVAGAGIVTGDPRLGPLANNGGPTQTLLPQAGSPAINAGDNAFAPNTPFDQRGPGFDRIEGGTIDLGAVEVQA